MSSILITGSNRGLGLEWVRQYAHAGWRVYATCRHPQQASELHALASAQPQISVHQLDVTSEDDIGHLAAQLADSPIDVLVNNAGVYFERWGKDKLGSVDYGDWEKTMQVNTLAPMRVSEALCSQVQQSDKKLIVTISSHMGSIAEITAPNDYAYRSSKAALNAAMKGLSLELVEDGIGVLLLHPGWVRTRMGGDSAPLSVEDSVAGMRDIVEGFRLPMSGQFYRYDGSIIPW